MSGPIVPLLEYAMTPAERKAVFRRAIAKRGHAGLPGTGPEGQTCGTCASLYRNQMSKTYLKCELARHRWTGGGGSDVRARDPACEKWTPALPLPASGARGVDPPASANGGRA